MPAIPSPSCVAPAYPSEAGLQKRGEAYNRAVETFNRDYKTYGECIKKYVEDTKLWVKAAADAGNKAIDEYNKYTEDLKKRIEADKGSLGRARHSGVMPAPMAPTWRAGRSGDRRSSSRNCGLPTRSTLWAVRPAATT